MDSQSFWRSSLQEQAFDPVDPVQQRADRVIAFNQLGEWNRNTLSQMLVHSPTLRAQRHEQFVRSPMGKSRLCPATGGLLLRGNRPRIVRHDDPG
jgi:hypothetical protein